MDFLRKGGNTLREEKEYSLNEDLASTAEKEWERHIEEKTHLINNDITDMFDQNGWAAWLRTTEGGGCPKGYVRPPDPDWCGHALANHALKMGKPISKLLCRKVFPSTFRLNSPKHWSIAGFEEVPRVDKTDDLKRGDIVVLRWENGKRYGDHITLAISDLKEDGSFETIEGNAKGKLPNGRNGRGLIKQIRNRAQIAKIYRLTEKHQQK